MPAEVAAQSRHYGMGGWLALFLLGLAALVVTLLVVGTQLAALLLPIFDRLPASWQVWGVAVLALTLWLTAATVVVLWRAITHRRSFPRSMLRLLALNALASLVTRGVNHHLLDEIGAFPQLGETLFKIVGSWIVSALFAWYFIASKRVNATYLHRLDAADPGTVALHASADLLRAEEAAAGRDDQAEEEIEVEGGESGQSPPLSAAPGLHPPPASAR